MGTSWGHRQKTHGMEFNSMEERILAMSYVYTFVKMFQVSKLCNDCLNPNSPNYQPFPYHFYIHVAFFIFSLNQEHYCSGTKMTFLAINIMEKEEKPTNIILDYLRKK